MASMKRMERFLGTSHFAGLSFVLSVTKAGTSSAMALLSTTTTLPNHGTSYTLGDCHKASLALHCCSPRVCGVSHVLVVVVDRREDRSDLRPKLPLMRVAQHCP